MGHALHDLTRHNAWATEQVLTFCKRLDEPALNATAPGTFGTILELLRHIIDAESSYLYRVSGAWTTFPWTRGEAVGLDLLTARAATLGR